MKKTKIAVGVIVALGVIWTGSAWFTGKQLEKNMDTLVQRANAQLLELAPGSSLQLSYQDYQRGIFSSHARFVVQSRSQTEDNALLKPGQSIVLKETIDHGPFPLAQLKKLNFLPGMASVHSELENTEALRKLFEITKGQSIVQAETRVGYSGGTDSAIHILPVDYQNAQSGERFAFNGGLLNVGVDNQGDRITLSGDFDSLSLTSKNQLDMPVLLNVNGLTFAANSRLSPEGLRLGDQSIVVKNLTVAVDGQEGVNASGLNGKSAFDSKDNRVSGTIDYRLDGLKLQGKDVGQGRLALKLADFDGQALKTFSANYNRQVQALSDDPALAANADLYQQRVSELLTSNLPLLLKGGPLVSVAPFSWKNAKGESSFNLNARFKDVTGSAPGEQSLPQQLDSVLKTLDSKLVISMDMATEMMTQVAMAEGYKQDEAAKLADQQVKGLAAMGQMFKLTTRQQNNIVTSLQYGNGEITMNGDKMPLNQFLSRYMLGGITQGGAQ